MVNQQVFSCRFSTCQLTRQTRVKNSNINFTGIKRTKGTSLKAKNKIKATAKVIGKSLEVGNYVTSALEVGAGVIGHYCGLEHSFVFDLAQKYLHIKPSMLAQAPYVDGLRHFAQGLWWHFAGKESTWTFVRGIEKNMKMTNLAKTQSTFPCNKSTLICAFQPLLDSTRS